MANTKAKGIKMRYSKAAKCQVCGTHSQEVKHMYDIGFMGPPGDNPPLVVNICPGCAYSLLAKLIKAGRDF